MWGLIPTNFCRLINPFLIKGAGYAQDFRLDPTNIFGVPAPLHSQKEKPSLWCLVLTLCDALKLSFSFASVSFQASSHHRCTVIRISEIWIGILLPKLFWSFVRKNCSIDWEKKFKIQGWRPKICKFFVISGTIFGKVRKLLSCDFWLPHLVQWFSSMLM